MWGESSNNCESNCQCSGLLTENFHINSGNSATKRKQEAALAHNYKLKMNPHSLELSASPAPAHKRRVLGELQNYKPTSPYIERLKQSPTEINNKLYTSNSPIKSFSPNSSSTKQFSPNSPLAKQFSPRSPLATQINSPLTTKFPPKFTNSPLSLSDTIKSPLLNSPIISTHSPLSTRVKRTCKINRIFEERSKFKSENKENVVRVEMEEEARDCSFSGAETDAQGVDAWSHTKLDFTSSLPVQSVASVPETEDLDELETLQDLETFDTDTTHRHTYEIIATDSPDIVRARTSRKLTTNFWSFGAPLADTEQSTSFNRPATRTLTFDDEDAEFPSPATRRPLSVKKSLKFTETPTKCRLRSERSDSSIGSMSLSPASARGLYTAASTASTESGFMSELEEPFLDIDETNSPKINNFEDLLSGKIKNNLLPARRERPSLARSLSFHPERSSNKRSEREQEVLSDSKRRRAEERPVLHRALSENNASIMSALARSAVEPDLIGDFSGPFRLPLTAGDHSDIRSITTHTLAALLRGGYDAHIHKYQVIDCRYPYEFSGGHVAGARNLYTERHILSLLEDGERAVLVFHCEYSLARAPALYRYLRRMDRRLHRAEYPALTYPEMYLVEGGYRAFHQAYPAHCAPRGYTPMLDPTRRS